jgi:hypothetical protein
MDTPAPSVPQEASVALLAAEIRHSAYLLGGALGLMGSFALLLLLLTARFGS